MDSAIKWHGGKAYLAQRINAIFPPHIHYVEPYFGGGSVLFAGEPEGRSEVVNDINADLTNFWDVLKGEKTFERFQRIIEATPLSEVEWNDAGDTLEIGPKSDTVIQAVAFFIRCRQSMAARFKCFAIPSRTRTLCGCKRAARRGSRPSMGCPPSMPGLCV